MATGDSNTFVTPLASKPVALARLDWNHSVRALLQNFYAQDAPTSENITLQSVATNPPNGMLYRDKDGRIYIWDSTHQKGSPKHGGSWTRNGIGPFVEPTLSGANVASYEVGELFVVAGSNARVYMKTNNSDAIVDIGLQPSNTSLEFAAGSVSSPSIGFFGDSGTGFYQLQDNGIGIALGGALKAAFTDTAFYRYRSTTNNLGGRIALARYSDNIPWWYFQSTGGTSQPNLDILFSTANTAVTIGSVDGNVTVGAHLDVNSFTIQGAALQGVPTGSIVAYAASSAPTGWLFCAGQAVSRTTYSDLWSTISDTFGNGDGSTTFNLPDLRGRAIFGKDNMGGSDAARLTSSQAHGVDGDTLGDSGGVAQHVLTSNQMPSHSHSGSSGTTSTDGSHNHNDSDINKGNWYIGTGGGQRAQAGTQVRAAFASLDSDGDHSHTVSLTISSDGNDEAHTNLPPALILNYIIKT